MQDAHKELTNTLSKESIKALQTVARRFPQTKGFLSSIDFNTKPKKNLDQDKPSQIFETKAPLNESLIDAIDENRIGLDNR